MSHEHQGQQSAEKATAAAPTHAAHAKAKPLDDAHEDWVAMDVLAVAADVLQNGTSREIHNKSAKDTAALWLLHAAVTGGYHGEKLTAEKRQKALDAALQVLSQHIAVYATQPDGRDWVAHNITPQLEQLKSDVGYSSAREQVHEAFTVDNQNVVDTRENADPKLQAQALYKSIPKLVETLNGLNEAVIQMHEPRIEHEIEALLANEPHLGGHYRSLLDVAHVLNVMEGWLVLNDDEVREKAKEIHSVLDAVTTVGELVKGVVLFTGGVLGLTLSCLGAVLRAAHEDELAAYVMGAARTTALKVGEVVAAIEFAWGLWKLLKKGSTSQERIDGGLEALSSGVMFYGQIAEVSMGPTYWAIRLGYAEAKLALQTYGAASEGLVAGMMGPAFGALRSYGLSIAEQQQQVIKAALLIEAERDEKRKHDLVRVLNTEGRILGELLDNLINALKAPALESGMANQPGAYKIFQQEMAPVFLFEGVREPTMAFLGATAALNGLTWIASHRDAILLASSRHGDLREAIDLADNPDGPPQGSASPTSLARSAIGAKDTHREAKGSNHE